MSWEAEMSVLGGMMLDRECANLAADALGAEMFQDADLGKIFGKALDLYWAGKPIDAVLLTQELPELSGLIIRTAEFVPKLGHFSEYVQIVQDEWQWGNIERKFQDLELSNGSLEDKVGQLRELVDEQERILGARQEKGLVFLKRLTNLRI